MRSTSQWSQTADQSTAGFVFRSFNDGENIRRRRLLPRHEPRFQSLSTTKNFYPLRPGSYYISLYLYQTVIHWEIAPFARRGPFRPRRRKFANVRAQKRLAFYSRRVLMASISRWTRVLYRRRVAYDSGEFEGLTKSWKDSLTRWIISNFCFSNFFFFFFGK